MENAKLNDVLRRIEECLQGNVRNENDDADQEEEEDGEEEDDNDEEEEEEEDDYNEHGLISLSGM